jgi:hypothetical protein
VHGRGRGDRDTELNELKDSSAADFCNDCTAPEFASNKFNDGFPCSPAAKMSSSESGLPKKSGIRCSPRRLGHAIREIGSEIGSLTSSIVDRDGERGEGNEGCSSATTGMNMREKAALTSSSWLIFR